MSRYLLLGKYTAEGLLRVQSDGYSTRPKSNAKVFESFGGTLECMYFMTPGIGEWDFCAIVECSGNDLFALTSSTSTSNIFERSEAHEIRTGEEADAILASGKRLWAPPGRVKA